MVVSLLLAAAPALWAAPPDRKNPDDPQSAIGRYSNCPNANPNDGFADDDALQDCLDAGGTILLTPGQPGYILRKGLRVTQPDTALGSARAPEKAVFIADPALNAPMLQARGEAPARLRIENLLFDGNKYQRRIDCQGYRDYGANISISGPPGVVITNIESSRAMCGSALEIYAEAFEVSHNILRDNGFDRSQSPATPEPWADGITAGLCRRGKVFDNTVEDSTDIGIVSGGGKGCQVMRNTIRQVKSHAFAGLAVHNFHGEGADDQEGSVFQGNTVTSEPGKLDFGISVGIHSWFPVNMTRGGRITGNSVSGSVVNLAVDGYENGSITDNLLQNAQGSFDGMLIDPNDPNCRLNVNATLAHAKEVCLDWRSAPVSFHGGHCLTEAPADNPCWPPPRDPRRPNGP